VFHGARSITDVSTIQPSGPGFNAAVNFIAPRRENRIVRVSRGNDFSSLMGPEWLQQEPSEGEVNYRIFQWLNGRREEADFVRVASPAVEEKSAPHYSCIPAEWACKLATRRWEPHVSMWAALRDA